MPYSTHEVLDGHDHFRAAMVALSYPGRRIPVEHASGVDQGCTGRQIVRALYDNDASVTTVATDGTTRGVRPDDASVLVVDGSTCHGLLDRIPRGTDEYPERGATVVYLVDGLPDSSHLHLSGPGVDGDLEIGVPLHPEDVMARNAVCRNYPTGIDILVTGDGWVTGLPRTTVIGQVDR